MRTMTDTAIEKPYSLLDDPNRLRSVTFIDLQDACLHCTEKILFNGEAAQIRVPKDFGWTITGGRIHETRVSMVVHPDDVTWGVRGADGSIAVQWTVGGLPVLVPIDAAGESLWERVEANPPDPAHPLLKDGRISSYPSARRLGGAGEVIEDETDHWVRVVMQVDEATAVHG